MRSWLVVAVLLIATTTFHGQAAIPCVNKYVTYDNLTQHQFDALVDFTFNVGCGNFRGSTLLKKLNRGDVTGAADEFPKWKYAGGKVLLGLIRRRAIEREIFLRP